MVWGDAGYKSLDPIRKDMLLGQVAPFTTENALAWLSQRLKPQKKRRTKFDETTEADAEHAADAAQKRAGRKLQVSVQRRGPTPKAVMSSGPELRLEPPAT
jgi:hypothetical protein